MLMMSYAYKDFDSIIPDDSFVGRTKVYITPYTFHTYSYILHLNFIQFIHTHIHILEVSELQVCIWLNCWW